VSRRVWKAVEASTKEVGMGETKERRSKGGRREKERGKKEEETKKGKNSGSKESSRRIENMG